MLKTYQAPGMLDWKLSVPVGKTFVSFHFHGGYRSAIENKSALFSTSDPALQLILESSPQFKKKQIVILSSLQDE
ncbi:MAG: hypothetical protein HDS10_00385 [Bacteroides sp.]|nr:hypothetical protein [Bacteroides sp.]